MAVSLLVLALVGLVERASEASSHTAFSTRVGHADAIQSFSATRIDVLQEWFAAVQQHQPGENDAALLTVARRSNRELLALRVDIGVLYMLVDNPSLRRVTFVPSETLGQWLSSEGLSARSFDFGGPLLEQMRFLAQRVRGAGAEMVARRGVLFHTDVTTLQVQQPQAANDEQRVKRGPFRIFIADARLKAISSSPVHLAIARYLTGRLGKGPQALAWVRDWYIATIAFQQSDQQYGSEHLREALRVLPGDPHLLLLAGGEHEALASPSVQLFRAEAKSSNIVVPVGSATDELRMAERFFKTAIDLAPTLIEARVRLGRVLGLRGRHEQAADHLRVAVKEAVDPQLQYYAGLFLGAELVQLSDRTGAREAYERAAGVYPRAPSPRLALAQIAWRDGDRQKMHAALDGALPGEFDEAADPWRAYHVAHGRDAALRLAAVRRDAFGPNQ